MAAIKKYNGSIFVDAAIRKYSTASEIIVPSTTIYCDGSNITTYTIKGNTVQNGTPTPGNPVEVNGVGKLTSNLFNKNTALLGYEISATAIVQSEDWAVSDYIPVTGDTQYIGGAFGNAVLEYETKGGSSIRINTKRVTDGFTTESITRYIRINLPITNLNYAVFNEGETVKPYEPWGYNIPILTNQTTTNIYLGSVSSNRQIKKLVLTGEETFSWNRSTTYSGGFFTSWSNVDGKSNEMFYCSHAQYVSDITDYVNGTCYSDGSMNIRIMPEGSTVEQWHEYLTQQYANGTPVTVWYVLRTATTGIVNEPLMKIGTYADSISNAAQIPTTEGANSITVDTTVQPSEFTATWTGWHDSSVKEYDGTNWQ